MSKLVSLTKVVLFSLLCVLCVSSFNFQIINNITSDTPRFHLPPTPDILELRERIDRILESYESFGYTIGLSVVSLDIPQVFYDLEKDTPLVPASNLKVITTAVGLDQFGSDFVWETDFFTGSTNNLYIRASGDPTWTDMLNRGSLNRLFRSIADSLRANGITTISGDIVIDPGTFSDFPLGVGWRETNRIQAYSALSSAIAFNENTVQAVIRPTTVGNRATISLSPVNTGFTIINNVNTTANRNSQGISFATEATRNAVRISGNIWDRSRPQYRTFAIPVPADYALHLFRTRLQEQGITIRGNVQYRRFTEENPTLSRYTRIFTIESLPLPRVLDEVNKRSNNFMSNQLFLTIGDVHNNAGDTENIIKRWLRFNSVAADSLMMFDGSGLSYENRCTVGLLTSILKVMYDTDNFEVFHNSLAISGQDGTLRNVFNCETLNRKVHAKTGFILGVRGLTGYIRTADGEMLGFSLIINHEGSRIRNFNRIAEAILLELATFTRGDYLLSLR
jgi:D-alanyl-D-alanine carboxypeptidase/D-alanyl-D-alanine-endopeptidase (penicillin-binding protein 4)